MQLSAESNDAELTDYLWPVIREIIKTSIENAQNIIIEGCYIPFGWEEDFTDQYRSDIKYVRLIFSREYIKNHIHDILNYENVIEKRLTTELAIDELIAANELNLRQCVSRNYNHILIEDSYEIDLDRIDLET